MKKAPDRFQQAKFVDLLRDGVRRDHAAAAVGSTSTRMWSLELRDKAFHELVASAQENGRPEFFNWIRKTLYDIAANPRHPQQTRAALALADIYLPETEHKRVTRIGTVPGEELAFGVNVRVSQEQLAGLTDEQLATLEAGKAVEKALVEGKPIPSLRALEGGGERE